MMILRKIFTKISCLLLCLTIISGCHSSQAEVKKEKVGDVELAYYTRGSGEPLVMIMGFRGTMAVWDPAFLEELEKKYTLILFDNRGAGLSTDSEKDLTTIDQMAKDTAELIRHLGYRKVHLLGWSMGSRIAMEMALQYPDLIETLILCSPNPGGKEQAIRKTDAYAELTAKELTQDKALSFLFPDTPKGSAASKDFMSRLKKAIIDGSVPYDIEINSRTLERQVNALKMWDKDNQLYEKLAGIHIPTLVAGGSADVLDSPENIKTVACKIPFAWSAYFPEAGHDFLSQNFKDFADLIMVFINTNKKDKK